MRLNFCSLHAKICNTNFSIARLKPFIYIRHANRVLFLLYESYVQLCMYTMPVFDRPFLIVQRRRQIKMLFATFQWRVYIVHCTCMLVMNQTVNGLAFTLETCILKTKQKTRIMAIEVFICRLNRLFSCKNRSYFNSSVSKVSCNSKARRFKYSFH